MKFEVNESRSSGNRLIIVKTEHREPMVFTPEEAEELGEKLTEITK